MKKALEIVFLLVVIIAASIAVAYQAKRIMAEEESRQTGSGSRGGFERFRTAQEENIREALDCSDKDWEAIQPILGKITGIQRESRIRSFGGSGMRPGRGPVPTPDPEADALRAVLSAEDATDEEIQSKIALLRESRGGRQEELKTARQKLREMITPRQEAALVVMGILD